jgi:hypothetical protein
VRVYVCVCAYACARACVCVCVRVCACVCVRACARAPTCETTHVIEEQSAAVQSHSLGEKLYTLALVVA